MPLGMTDLIYMITLVVMYRIVATEFLLHVTSLSNGWTSFWNIKLKPFPPKSQAILCILYHNKL